MFVNVESEVVWVPTSAQHKVLGKIPSIIYALIDPFSGEVRYIGKTTDSLQSRWGSHVRHASDGGTHKNHWIQSCITDGMYPYIEQVDAGVWDLETINQREKYWIDKYSSLYKLTNLTTGGDGNSVLEVSIETRTKLSMKSKENWERPEYRALRGAFQSEYWKNNDRARSAVSRQTSARWADPKYKARETFKSAEYRERRSKLSAEFFSSAEGRKIASEAGSKSIKLRRTCNDCGYLGAPPHVGSHHKRTGHTGYTDVGVE